MTLVLAQTVTGQGPNPQLLMVFGIIGLAVLVALGGRFFVNLFEVITAPTASLGHHGRNDQFFFSLFVVFLGGLIGSVLLLIKEAAITDAFRVSAEMIAKAASEMNGNPVYRDDAMVWGTNEMMSNFDIYVVGNFIFFPVVVVVCWLLAGSLFFLFTKLLGGQCSLSDFLGSVAYGSFFIAIGWAMQAAAQADAIQMIQTQTPSGQMEIMSIVGTVLYIYGLVLYLIGMAQGAQMTGGQVVGAILLYLIIFAIGVYLVFSQVVTPRFDDFQRQIQSHDPSR